MTELEMLEAEKYWCENCCNWDKEHVQMDGYAKCKLTGTLCFCQESGKGCKCFDVPAENVIAPPCKVGDLVYALWEAPIPEKYVVYAAEVKEISIKKRNCRLTYNYIVAPLCFAGRTKEYLDEDFGKLIFPTEEEAEAKLKGGAQG